MDSEHIPNEVVRAYLLGVLDDVAASEVERRYFVGRSCLENITIVERNLIENYLDGVLPADEAALFENRYLRIPCLKEVVQEVRRQRSGNLGAGRWRQWVVSLAFSGAVACILAVSIWFIWTRIISPPANVANVRHEQIVVPVRFRLYPGVSKSASAEKTQMNQPPRNAPVILAAELPGAVSGVDAKGRLTAVHAAAPGQVVWSGPLEIKSVNGKPEFNLTLAPSMLNSGDYVLQVTTADGRVDTTYLFRVLSPQ